MIERRLKTLSKKLQKRYPIDFGVDYQNSVFLAGCSRSGTTWLSNLINYKNEYRYIFEPFRPSLVSVCSHFKDRQYIRPSNKDDQFLRPAKAVLSGKVRSQWSDKLNNRLISNKRLIKDVCSNLLLRWLHESFPGLTIILPLRHPCAVATSRIKLNWDNSLDKFLCQEDLMDDFLRPFRKQMQTVQDAASVSGDLFEVHIFSWCIENYVPLKQFSRDEILIIFYEEICTNPASELDKLFSFIGQEYDQTVFEKLKKPSSVTRNDSSVVTGGSLIDSWRKNLTEDQLKKAIEILSLFGLEKLYSDSAQPYTQNLSGFLLQPT